LRFYLPWRSIIFSLPLTPLPPLSGHHERSLALLAEEFASCAGGKHTSPSAASVASACACVIATATARIHAIVDIIIDRRYELAITLNCLHRHAEAGLFSVHLLITQNPMKISRNSRNATDFWAHRLGFTHRFLLPSTAFYAPSFYEIPKP
jgi:hypothetical protein